MCNDAEHHWSTLYVRKPFPTLTWKYTRSYPIYHKLKMSGFQIHEILLHKMRQKWKKIMRRKWKKEEKWPARGHEWEQFVSSVGEKKEVEIQEYPASRRLFDQHLATKELWKVNVTSSSSAYRSWQTFSQALVTVPTLKIRGSPCNGILGVDRHL